MEKQAKKIVEEIRGSIEPGDVAYVSADGTWEWGQDGCQPGYTQCVSSEDFDAVCLQEIYDNVEDFLVRMNREDGQ